MIIKGNAGHDNTFVETNYAHIGKNSETSVSMRWHLGNEVPDIENIHNK